MKHTLTELGEALYGKHWRQPLADYLGVSRQAVHDYEKGYTTIKPETVHRIKLLLANRAADLYKLYKDLQETLDH